MTKTTAPIDEDTALCPHTLKAPKKWRWEEEKEKAELAFRNSYESPRSSSAWKESDKEHGNRQMWSSERQLYFPPPFLVMTDLCTESDQGMQLWSTWLGNMLEDNSAEPSHHFVPHELGPF